MRLCEPVTVVPNALLVPGGGVDDPTVVDACGAPIVDAGTFRHGLFVPARFLDRGGLDVTASLQGVWLFGGVQWPHFGHMLFETLSRLWAVPLLDGKVDGIVFFRGLPNRGRPGADLQGPLESLLRTLGVDLPVSFIDVPTAVDQLVVPRQGCGMGALSAGTPAFRDFIRDRLQRISPRAGMERIYLTREGYRNRRGGIFAESHLRQLLEAEGYVAFSPERVSFEEQVATYRGARRIIGPDSSAMHLVGFVAPPRAEVAIILRRHGGARDLLPQLTGFMGRKPLVIDAIARLIQRDNERNPNWSVFAELDFPVLRQALADGGFLDGDAEWKPLRRITRRRVLNHYQKRLGGKFETIWPAQPDLPDTANAVPTTTA